jgi:hypothetical protein
LVACETHKARTQRHRRRRQRPRLRWGGQVAREALDRRDQDLGLVADLAAEVAPAGTPGRHDDRLGEFAERIGWLDRGKRLGDLGDLGRTATVWSKPERIDPSGHVVNVWTAGRLNG